ncbi:MAG: CDP-diacylglycerol--glycerol-3-phosphate 3-phosphatidyltransferase [Holosporales bacterium]|jgi:cardiolipin synthase|nr:CDP-diacylglycerol--glycerol-3-phosphate 3-phosphatidyltransferase [Holosporales bacterium]
MRKIVNIPNILTMSRIIILPFFAFGFFSRSKFGIYLSLSIFLICCATDFLDGYYARTHKQTTKLGQMLDPMADKILTAVAILFIVGFDFVSIFAIIPAAVILCREIIISGIRDAVTFRHKSFRTSKLAKWKTASQMISIALLMYSKAIDCHYLSMIGEFLFWISAIVTAISGVMYCRRHLLGIG